MLPHPLAELPLADPALTLRGQPGAVDLWCLDYPAVSDEQLWAAWERLMTPEERSRRDRFVFERDRRMFLATRALVRTVLSRYAAVAPADWRFAAGPHGRPYVAAPDAGRSLHFNLSNTRGLVVCAVSVAHPEVGVDTERLDRSPSSLLVADRFFAADEVAALRALPPALQPERFLAYWTLKESYIKARGLGLALPLEQFAFLLDQGGEIAVAFDPRMADDPRRWRFALLERSPEHLVAIAAETGGTELALRVMQFVPPAP